MTIKIWHLECYFQVRGTNSWRKSLPGENAEYFAFQNKIKVAKLVGVLKYGRGWPVKFDNVVNSAGIS